MRIYIDLLLTEMTKSNFWAMKSDQNPNYMLKPYFEITILIDLDLIW